MNSVIVSFFSIFVVLVPILSIYATPINGLNVGELCCFGFWLVAGLRGELTVIRVRYLSKKFFQLIIFMFVSFFVASLVYGFSNDALFRLFRFSFYYLTAFVLGDLWFDLEKFQKSYRVVAVLSIIFLLLQYFSYYVLGQVLRGFIPGVSVYLEQYELIDYADMYSRFFFRPTSFFLEPAHYVQFLLPALVLSLYRKKSYYMAAVISVAILLSTSGQGIVIGAVIWCVFFGQRLFQRKVKKKQLIATAVLIPVILLVILMISKTSIFRNTVGRLTQVGSSSAFSARFSGYSYVVENLSIFSFFFGHGYGNVPTGSWLPGLAYMLYGAGIVGCIFLLSFLIGAWKLNDHELQGMVVIFAATLIESSVLNNMMVIIYLCYIQALSFKKKDFQ